MNIAEVIAWKFDNQEGMRCAEDENGVLVITEFPGSIPTQTTQQEWVQEYNTWRAAEGHLDVEAQQVYDSVLIRAVVAEFVSILTAAGIAVPTDIGANIKTRVKNKLRN